MRVQVPPRAQTKQRISPGQSTFYGVTVRGLSPDLSHEAAPPESAGRGSRSPAQHMSTRSTAKVFPQRTCADVVDGPGGGRFSSADALTAAITKAWEPKTTDGRFVVCVPRWSHARYYASFGWERIASQSRSS